MMAETMRILILSIYLSVVTGFISQRQQPWNSLSVCRTKKSLNNNHRHDSEPSVSRGTGCSCRRSNAFLHRTNTCSSLYSRSDDDDKTDSNKKDADDIDLGDQDWRAFRAKLVMSEPDKTSVSPSSSNVEQEATFFEEEDDLDGIGAVFASSSPTTKSSTVDSDDGSESKGTSNKHIKLMTPLDPSQWAYDSGKVIEKGAVILGGVEQDYGFGLRQQYFHKASILILDHDDNVFTKAIILNRPTDIMLQDDDDDDGGGEQWRVWFGGDVQGINSHSPEIICLHSLPTDNEKVANASTPIMKDIQWTTFDSAKSLVRQGIAKTSDFWVFCGYAGWGPQQLMGELERKSWYMVATDSQTLLKELARLSAGVDPRDAGLETWTLLMNMIGRGETAEECDGDFDDLILKEWAREHLLSSDAGGGAGTKQVKADDIRTDPINALTQIIAAAASARISESKMARDKGGDSDDDGDNMKVGSLLRASSADRSPFLLDNQEFHKSIVLVIGDDNNLSVGAILNRPAAKDLDMQITDKTTGKSQVVSIPLRYGGQYAVKGQDPLLWLHCHPRLREAQVGSPCNSGLDDGDDDDDDEDNGGIWKCTAEDVTGAIQQGLARPEDFIVVSGVCVWTKGQLGALSLRGMQSEVKPSYFDVVPSCQIDEVWKSLLKQEKLTNIGLRKYIESANEVWNVAESTSSSADGNENMKKKEKYIPISGLGEGFDEEDDTLVFNSDVKVKKLADDALLSWIATFLLGAPTLGVQ